MTNRILGRIEKLEQREAPAQEIIPVVYIPGPEEGTVGRLGANGITIMTDAEAEAEMHSLPARVIKPREN